MNVDHPDWSPHDKEVWIAYHLDMPAHIPQTVLFAYERTWSEARAAIANRLVQAAEQMKFVRLKLMPRAVKLEIESELGVGGAMVPWEDFLDPVNRFNAVYVMDGELLTLTVGDTCRTFRMY